MVSTPEADYYACALPFLVEGLRVAFSSPLAHASIVQLAPWARCGGLSRVLRVRSRTHLAMLPQLSRCNQRPNRGSP